MESSRVWIAQGRRTRDILVNSRRCNSDYIVSGSLIWFIEDIIPAAMRRQDGLDLYRLDITVVYGVDPQGMLIDGL